MSRPVTYVVIFCRAWMNESGYGFDYFTPSDRRWQTHAAAVDEGLRLADSDDFNIGKLEGGRLVAMLWMHEDIGEPPSVLAQIAESIGVP